MNAKNTDLYPFPELIDGKRWKITKTDPTKSICCCSLSDRVLFVPLGNSKLDLAMRTHELLHVKWSPDTETLQKYKVTALTDTMLAVEDCRIRLLGERQSAKIAETLEGFRSFDGVLKKAFSKLTPKNKVLMVLSASDRRGHRKLYKLLDINLKYIVNGARIRLNQDFKSTIRVSNYIDKIFEEYNRIDDLAEKYNLENTDELKKDYMWAIDDGSLVEESPDEPFVLSWDKCRVVEEPKLCHRRSNNNRGVVFPRQEGVVPRYIYRDALDDAKCFGKRVISTPRLGSLLIDGSSSMSLNLNEVRNVVEKYGPDIVAVYGGSVVRKDDGVIAIVARGNRISEEITSLKGREENLIDLPALEWLAMQKPPRVWMSDRIVTTRVGYSEIISISAKDACAAVCKKANVLVIRSLGDIDKVFSKKVKK